jgi:hypothetical protein
MAIDQNLLASLLLGYAAPPKPTRGVAPAPVVPVRPVPLAVAPAVPVTTTTVPPANPVPAPMPDVMYKDPISDPSLYTYVKKPVPETIDFGKFPVPQMPTYQQMPTMPQRQFQQEAAGAQKASLRAGLIGLLLGGGAGAVAAAGGAQQAYQQNVQNQYEQALREYQNRASLTEMANAQAAQRYRDELAARQAAVGEAGQAMQMRNAVAQAGYENVAGEQAARIARAQAEAQGIKGRTDLLTSLAGLTPAAQPGAAKFIAEGGAIPTGIAKVGKIATPMTVSQAIRLVMDFNSSRRSDDPVEDSRQAQALRESLLASPDNQIQQLAKMVSTKPLPNIDMIRLDLERQRLDIQKIENEADRKEADRKYQLDLDQFNALERYRNRSIALDKERLALTQRNASGTAKPEDNQKFADSIVKQMMEMQRRRQDVFTQMQSSKISRTAGQRVIDEIDNQLRDMDTNYAFYLARGADAGGGIMTGTPVAKRFFGGPQGAKVPTTPPTGGGGPLAGFQPRKVQ